MACQEPSVAVVMPGMTANGKACLKFCGSAKAFFSGKLSEKQRAAGVAGLTKVSRDRVKILPCKQCLGCRLERSRIWACRIIHETKFHDCSSFLTLTYDDKNLVESLDRSRIQTFFRDLRRRLDYRSLGKLKFYYVGEYGEKTGRPHYHAILFGGPFGRSQCREEEPARGGSPQWSSEHIGAVWPEGLHRISEVTFESAAYVARYALKKVTGAAARAHYGARAPEFGQPSQGVGKKWFEAWKDDTYPAGTVVFPGRGEFMAPEYYDRLLEKVDPALFARVKDERARGRKIFETIDDYLSHTERRYREGVVAGLRAKACLVRGVE
ncbi:VP4 [Kummerowia striata gokushovirus]|nr:VP4 [Kummerowia striata gokushovirus]